MIDGLESCYKCSFQTKLLESLTTFQKLISNHNPIIKTML